MSSGDVAFTTEHLIRSLAAEADLVVDRGIVTRGQRLVIRNLLLQARDEIERLSTAKHPTPPFGVISDGFGSSWTLCKADCGLQVVRPGKVQCDCDMS